MWAGNQSCRIPKGLDIAEKAIKKQVEMQPIRDYNNDIKKIGVPARHAKQD